MYLRGNGLGGRDAMVLQRYEYYRLANESPR